MIFSNYAVVDLETGSRNRLTTQPLQIAAVIVDGRKLSIVDRFQSLIKPLGEIEAKEKGLDPIEEEALKVNQLNIEELAKAPDLKNVWESFVSFVNKWSGKKGDTWSAPIIAGFNIKNFDIPILDRIAKEYGPWDEKRHQSKVFHPFHHVDLVDDVHRWFENNIEIKSLSMDSMRDLFGISKIGAHNAIKDTTDIARILVGFLNIYRHFSPRINFRGNNGTNL